MKKIPLYHLNTGSCNGCDIEFLAVARNQWNDYQFEIVPLEKAKVIVVTGVLSQKSKPLALKALKKTKAKILALGSCANSTGIFAGGYPVTGPLDKYIKPHWYLAGCPPKPELILEAILKLTNQKANFPQPEIPPNFRGRLEYKPELCIRCLNCLRVCPAQAIQAQKTKSGLKLSFYYDRCVFCGLCQESCPTQAIRLTQDYKMIEKSRKKFKTEGLAKFSSRRS